MLGPSLVLWYAAGAWLALGILWRGEASTRSRHWGRDLELLLLSPFGLLVWGAIAFGWSSTADAMSLQAWAAYVTHGLAIGQIALTIGLWVRHRRDVAYALPAAVVALVITGQAWVLAAKSVISLGAGA